MYFYSTIRSRNCVLCVCRRQTDFNFALAHACDGNESIRWQAQQTRQWFYVDVHIFLLANGKSCWRLLRGRPSHAFDAPISSGISARKSNQFSGTCFRKKKFHPFFWWFQVRSATDRQHQRSICIRPIADRDDRYVNLMRNYMHCRRKIGIWNFVCIS